MDPLIAAAWLATMVVAAAGGYTLAELRHKYQPPALSAQEHLVFKDELLDLRYIKEILDHPPEHHEHIYARKPDPTRTKMGWEFFRCTYKDCPAFEWRAAHKAAT